MKPLTIILAMLLSSSNVFAATNANIYETVLDAFVAAASGWAATGYPKATWLFWTLTLISMIWTFGMMALRKADLAEFFAEFFRFTMFTGFFWWLLINGPIFGDSIIRSLRAIGGEATGLGPNLTPSSVADIGFDLFFTTLDKASMTSPLVSLTAIALGLFVLLLFAYVATEMLVLLISGWILLFGGVFFLGFGGSRWTSDIAINYYKTALGVGSSLLGMTFVIGVGASIMDQYYRTMGQDLDVKGLAVVLVVAFIMTRLVDRVPALISGIITGASIGGHGGALGFGAGAAIGGAAGMAAGAIGTAVSMTAAGAVGAAGGASAIMAAVSQGNQNVSAGNDVVSRMGGAMAESSGVGGGLGSGASGPGRSLAEQMGAGMMGVAPAAASGGGQRSQGAGQAGSGTQASGGLGAKPAGDSSGGGAKGGASSVKGDAGAGKQASGGQGSKTAGGFSPPKGTGGLFGSAAKVAVDAAANLAVGGWDVGAAKVGAVVDAAKERVGQTVGGQVATAIRTRGTGSEAPPAFDGDSLGASATDTAVDAAAEVAAFRDRRTA